MKKKNLRKEDQEFIGMMTVPIKDIYYIFHEIISKMRRLSRDGKLEDYEFAMLHQTVDLILRQYQK